MYYDTPARYFRMLGKAADLDVVFVPVNGMNQMSNIIEAAEKFDAKIIGVRIFNADDYNKVKLWLEESADRKAVLFHSTSYPYGCKLFTEFPEQTSFDDINPIIG